MTAEPFAPNLVAIPVDLAVPVTVGKSPAAGKRVRQTLPAYGGTGVFHTLYLPPGWSRDRRYPVIVEYAGNGPCRSSCGDVSTGRVEDSCLGYGISGGKDFIWVCLPFVSAEGRHSQLRWWGDIEATVTYCITTVEAVCRDYAGDPSAVFLAGFSRGAIACNFIGLHDDRIAALWRGFIVHSHYDGVKEWEYAGSDRRSAAGRLGRLRGRPQFISQEGSIEGTRSYLAGACPAGSFTFVHLPYPNHTDTWVLRDIPQRRMLRDWVGNILRTNSNR